MSKTDMSGTARIIMERSRQIFKEGWTENHDDEHDLGELSNAAACYAAVASAQVRGASAEEFTFEIVSLEMDWPWGERWWKPSPDPVRNLEKAGALIAAEIDRLERGRGDHRA